MGSQGLDSKPAVAVDDVESQIATSGRIQYAPDVEDRIRQRIGRTGSRLSRSRSRDAMSIRSARRVDPSVALPPIYRTVSFGIDEKKDRSFAKDDKVKSKKQKQSAVGDIYFGEPGYHTANIDELFSRFSSSRSTGLSSTQVTQLLKEYGRNVPSSPPSQWFRKTISYLYGDFGAILFVAAILVFISWRPLGHPPSLSPIWL